MLVHLFIDECLGCFHTLTIVNNVMINTLNKYLFETVFYSFEYIPVSKVAGLYGNFIFKIFYWSIADL